MDQTSATLAGVVDVAQWVAQESVLFNEDGSPFAAHVHPGAAGLTVVAGENASGKSLFVRVLAAKALQGGVLPISVSIRERSGSGTAEMARFRQNMMFGDETEQSTGATSVNAIRAAFGNLDRPQGSILLLDEPELGLSDGYAHALGRYIGQQAQQVPAACSGTVVVTHSRSLVTGLVDAYGKTPTFVSVGAQPTTLDEWLTLEERRTVEDLLALPHVGLERWRTANAILRQK